MMPVCDGVCHELQGASFLFSKWIYHDTFSRSLSYQGRSKLFPETPSYDYLTPTACGSIIRSTSVHSPGATVKRCV